MKSRRAKACDIPQSVKKRVWERDGGRCIFCGSTVNVMPNAHFIPRSAGGLGIEQNVMTACTRFGPGDCHYKFDNGTEREEMREKAREHFRSIYPDWDEQKLYYRRNP
jgi:5-methylcytosine-specific restriction endonuclease McrA